MSKSYIEYWTPIEKDEDDFTRDITYTTDKISFNDLEKHKNCIDWRYISGNITEETCTEEFYKKFSKHLNWYDGKFLNYVSEDYLFEMRSAINISTLFAKNRQFSEEFISKFIGTIDTENHKFRCAITDVINYQKDLSTEFLDKTIFTLFDKTENKDNYYYRDYTLCSIGDNLTLSQKITKEQFLNYVIKYPDYFKKFSRFIALVNPKNEFDGEFIKSNKKGFNEKDFLQTKQVTRYLANNRISEEALKIFKSKLDWVGIINRCENTNAIEYMIPICKKELFDVFIKYSDKVYPRKLDWLRSKMS